MPELALDHGTPTARPVEPDSRVEIRALSDVLGAEVIGADLSKPVSPDTIHALRQALLEHCLVVVRDQHLSAADIERFARCFGDIESNFVKKADGKVLETVHAISNFDADGKPTENALFTKSNYGWHTDKAYLPTPSLSTMLYGVEIPWAGGDTQFANVQRAYDDLPPGTKAQLDGLRVVQSFAHMLEGIGCPPGAIDDVPPPVEHPLVRTHPETGKKSLFVSTYSCGVVGMAQEQAVVLLAELFAHATREKYVFTHKWRKNDLVFWDNRSTLHRAIANYDLKKERRVLLRCVVRGTVPF